MIEVAQTRYFDLSAVEPVFEAETKLEQVEVENKQQLDYKMSPLETISTDEQELKEN